MVSRLYRIQKASGSIPECSIFGSNFIIMKQKWFKEIYDLPSRKQLNRSWTQKYEGRIFVVVENGKKSSLNYLSEM